MEENILIWSFAVIFGIITALIAAKKGRNPVGWFAPDHKIMAEAFTEIADALEPIKKRASLNSGVWRGTQGGRIEPPPGRAERHVCEAERGAA